MWNGVPPLAAVYHRLVLLPVGCVAVSVRLDEPQLVAPVVLGAEGSVCIVAVTGVLPLSQPVEVWYALT